MNPFLHPVPVRGDESTRKGREKDQEKAPTACGEFPLAFDFTTKQIRQLHHSLPALTVQGTLLEKKKSGKRTSTGAVP